MGWSFLGERVGRIGTDVCNHVNVADDRVGDRFQHFVASRLTRPEESREQCPGLAVSGDGLREVADLALDGLEGVRADRSTLRATACG
jgi:hypothetical protein